MEVFSKISIRDFPHIFGPFPEFIWKPHGICFLDIPFKLMDDVEPLLHALRVLLDAREVGDMPELVCLVLVEEFTVLFEGASITGVDLESLIENTLYSGVVFLYNRTPRVEISGNGPPRVYGDEYCVLVPA